MSINQNNQRLRYIKRNNLDAEAKIIGNYYLDIINSYGVDCTYFKVDFDLPDTFETTLSANIYKNIYGYDSSIMTYQLSTDMVTYMEVEDDIFMMNKYGVIPETDITFYFDIKAFASKFAVQLGQYDEFPIDSIIVNEELSAGTLSFSSTFTSDVVSGIISIDESGLADTSGIIQCSLSATNDPLYSIAVNDMLAKYDSYEISGGSAEPYAFMSYNTSGNQLSGVINGTVLYYSLDEISRYINKIRPKVGDILRVDFPGVEDEDFEQYEITDAMDRKLSQDGINPLLHKYVWKCKAVRRMPSHEDLDSELNADEFMDVLRKKQFVDEEIADQIDDYSDDVDEVYGGYDGTIEETDKDKVDDVDLLDATDGMAFTIFEFDNGSSLYTDGYDIFFSNTLDEITKLTVFNDVVIIAPDVPTELNYLKATDNSVYFMNIEGDVAALVATNADSTSQYSNALNVLTNDDTMNIDATNFYRFTNTLTMIYCDVSDLYIRLGNDNETIVKMT